uniref:Small hydrophilic plant seed protein n=1 Tax=Podoviridae sp. ct9A73 TaxID=2825225 RepID=A0A8S5UJS6_9CAUD|nr:MAG TPA: Small hydrophilic plant seed protein [Podoviridae sp. ct9A73]
MKQSKYDKRLTHGNDYYKKIGKLGGSAKVKKGFGKNPQLASIAGKKGGRATPYAELSFSAADNIKRVLLKNEKFDVKEEKSRYEVTMNGSILSIIPRYNGRIKKAVPRDDLSGRVMATKDMATLETLKVIIVEGMYRGES